jgi:hypothetical protein
VKETDSKVAAANSFTIFAGNRLLVVAASSESEKNKWMEDLELALEHSMSNKVETSKVLYPSLKSNSKCSFDVFSFYAYFTCCCCCCCCGMALLLSCAYVSVCIQLVDGVLALRDMMLWHVESHPFAIFYDCTLIPFS